ncbi:MAG: DUF1634 domain-containing protein [Dehalococcoidia bacterium]|nr:MAG: DUF1634 domain-containing protein [Dehalococcoidia bacterium]
MAASARTRILPVEPGLERQPEPARAHPFEIWISNTLRIGVLIAAAILSCGLVLLFVRGHEPGDAATLHQLIHSRSTAVSLRQIIDHLRDPHASDIIRLGILALILTPVVRVAMTAWLFLALRDWVFLAIVLVVFGVLMVGLTGTVG